MRSPLLLRHFFSALVVFNVRDSAAAIQTIEETIKVWAIFLLFDFVPADKNHILAKPSIFSVLWRLH